MGRRNSTQKKWYATDNILKAACCCVLVAGVWFTLQAAAQSSSNLGGSTAAAAQKQAEADDTETPVRSVPDPGAITTNQSISPAGVQSVFESRVYGIAFGADSKVVYAATNAKGGATVYKMDWPDNKVVEKLHATSSNGMQSLAYDAATNNVVMTGMGKAGVNLVRDWTSGKPDAVLGQHQIGSVAISAVGAAKRYAVVALTFDDAAGILDLATGAVIAKVKTGIAPFGVVIATDNTTAYVSNWGGRFPKASDKTAPTGMTPGADQIVIDARGVAASGTVSKIDLQSGKVTAEIAVGLHPTGLAMDATRHRLYVANSNSDTISVIDTNKNVVVETFAVQPFARDVAGVAPESLAISADGTRLYVACAGINAVAVLELAQGRLQMDGLIPTGWYPDDVVLSGDGKYLGVATLLGVGSGWKNAPIDKTGRGDWPTQHLVNVRYVHSYRGTVHVVAVPDKMQLLAYTRAVAEDNHLPLRVKGAAMQEAQRQSVPYPLAGRNGGASPIQHIIYVIKENRSYDQYFGSIGEGNGDPTLDTYGDDVLPNQRQLAREFVLLDNFYATGGNSADGHQWLTQASETDYTYWPGYGGRSYPADGEDPMADASGGFLWNALTKANKSFIDFGEYAGNGVNGANPEPKPKILRSHMLQEFKNGTPYTEVINNASPIASMNPYLVKEFPGWSLDVPDVVRAQMFAGYLKKWEKADKMPDLVMVQLPSDHTAGMSPGFSTPRACMADNDYAVGMLVDSISHSKFWGSTLVLIVEDDAQAGPDHVDGHRTVALAISPWIKRNAVDSTFYSHPSMLKTIEEILGLRNMSLFDLIANDMRNSFQTTPNMTPYTAVEPAYSIYTVAPPLKAMNGQLRLDALASMKMDFHDPDAAPTDRLNHILWRDAVGGSKAYPKLKQAVFAPFSNDLSDDEKDKMAAEKKGDADGK